MKEIFSKLQHMLESRWHMLALLLAAMLTTVLSFEHYAIPVFVLWIVFILLVDANFTDILLPVLLLNAMAIRTIGQTTYHEKHIWLAIPAAIAIVLHFVIFPRRITFGKTFLPLCAVSAALLLGGVGVISTEEYFNVSSLYYVVFLGVGMVGFYLWMRSHMTSSDSYSLKERILEILYIFGIFCAFSILEKAYRMLLGYGEIKPFPWCNDICEMMLFALPVPFFYARRRFLHFFVPFLFYAAMLPAMSMTAIGVGAVILALGVAYAFVYCKEKRLLISVIAGLLLVAATIALPHFLNNYESFFAFIGEQENGRLDLFKRAWSNFLAYPIFGVGMGAGNNGASVLNAFWTHNYFLQILGSLGIVGALAFGYQLFIRAKLALKRPDAFRLVIALSYLGIFLASMLQPGEFCPMPYEFLAVALFVVLERTEGAEDVRISVN